VRGGGKCPEGGGGGVGDFVIFDDFSQLNQCTFLGVVDVFKGVWDFMKKW